MPVFHKKEKIFPTFFPPFSDYKLYDTHFLPLTTPVENASFLVLSYTAASQEAPIEEEQHSKLSLSTG